MLPYRPPARIMRLFIAIILIWVNTANNRWTMLPTRHATTARFMCADLSGYACLSYWRPTGCSKGKYYKTALGIAILANWGAFYGNTSVTYPGEILVKFRNIEQGAWGFWLKWVGLNLQWSILSPAAAAGGLWLLVQRSKAEALDGLPPAKAK